MDTWSVALVILTATVLIILVSSNRGRFPILWVSRSHCGRLRGAGEGPARVPPVSLLACSSVRNPGGRLIWSTQIPALQFVSEHEPQGVACADLKPFYVELVRRYPEICDGHEFHAWGQLLVDLDLFRVRAKCVHITPAGRGLLEMLLAVVSLRRENFIHSGRSDLL